MRMTSLTAMIALIAVGLAMGQGPGGAPPKPAPNPAKPDPNSLEAMIAAALRSNADIVHAEAKVGEASAALNAARMKVMQSVITAHGAVQTAKGNFGIAQAAYERVKKLAVQAVISREEVDKAQFDLQRSKGELATAEAQLAILIGKTPGQGDARSVLFDATDKNFAAWADGRRWTVNPSGQLMTGELRDTVRYWDVRSTIFGDNVTAAPVAGSMNERIRDGLKKPLKIENWKEPLPVDAVIDYLKKKVGAEVPFRVLYSRHTTNVPTMVDLMAGEMPLSAWLSVIEDSVPDIVFVVREYGILVTNKDRMPDDGLRVREFLLRTEPKPDTAKKP